MYEFKLDFMSIFNDYNICLEAHTDTVSLWTGDMK